MFRKLLKWHVQDKSSVEQPMEEIVKTFVADRVQELSEIDKGG